MKLIMPFIYFVRGLIIFIVFVGSFIFVFITPIGAAFWLILFVYLIGVASCADLRSAEEKAAAAEKARLNDAEKARLQVAADRFAADKTKAVGGFIDSLASCNTTSILLVGGGLFAIFCIILFTIAAQRSI
jgi:hypothetical protein